MAKIINFLRIESQKVYFTVFLVTDPIYKTVDIYLIICKICASCCFTLLYFLLGSK